MQTVLIIDPGEILVCVISLGFILYAVVQIIKQECS